MNAAITRLVPWGWSAWLKAALRGPRTGPLLWRTVLVSVLLGGLLAPEADAGYSQWETVTLPLGSGASCGNGTTYRLFVNRAWRAKDTVIVFEGGSMCSRPCARRAGT